jgi:hypothetical protein
MDGLLEEIGEQERGERRTRERREENKREERGEQERGEKRTRERREENKRCLLEEIGGEPHEQNDAPDCQDIDDRLPARIRHVAKDDFGVVAGLDCHGLLPTSSPVRICTFVRVKQAK